MAELIKIIEEKDFAKVPGLFDNTKSVQELKWLFSDSEDPEKYNALVVIDENDQLIGIIGYVTSIYREKEKFIKGVFPMSWKIKEGHKGFAGVLLMKKALEMGDFAFTTGGTKTALSLFPIFKFKQISKGYKYYRIFNLLKFFKSTDEGFISKTVKTILLIPSMFKIIPRSSIYSDLTLELFDFESNIKEEFQDSSFHKPITKDYLKWLTQCPLLETHVCNIKKGDRIIGICAFFIRKINSEFRGRIVYMSYLGEDKKLWKSALYKSFEFFKDKKCNSVSTIATNKEWMEGYSIGMSKFAKSRPIYIKDTKSELENVDLNNWSIQYTEGDTGYLNI